MEKITAYGVRPTERPYFEQLNQYHFEMHYVADLLTHANVAEAQGSDAVLVRGNCVVDQATLQQFKAWGIHYVFTRSVGYNHMDVAAAQHLGIRLARVPGYSPFAVAELALTLGLTLFRRVDQAVDQTRQGDFTVGANLFSREIHTATVGIIGAGRIGLAEAQLYRGLGAQVISYDHHPSAAAHAQTRVCGLDELLAQSDVVSLHIPYVPGKNEHFINQDRLAQMKPTAILVNTARGEVVDETAVLRALDQRQLGGYGTDVFPDETTIMGHDFKTAQALPTPAVKQLVTHPHVLVTPHVGSYTVSALQDMITISYDNFHTAFTTGKVPNAINA